ncbi:DinB family protein [Flavobacterium cellulosilyticum]|uniref:DinB family protein n=1 Tax=Flavobacterium cellulosilyticum TaxID=2541731 RepID=A0A4R5CGF9_9FLAO|nr:DinB family protein [Flavobacterium cellulosilyticum]TDD98765.1 DinB family protein [Flavobacterium cellulosilyticum]
MEYRPGAIGAMTDEYEKALLELKTVLQTISNDRFLVKDDSKETDFKSIRNITLHIVNSGYVYSNYIRKSFGKKIKLNEIEINSVEEALYHLDKMFQYKIDTFENKWLLSDEEMMKTRIHTSWTKYDLEAIIEHSIVHILRHRLQIQKEITKINLA